MKDYMSLFSNDNFGICQVLAQLFWISVSVLESDYEYEFLLAMRLLDKVLSRLPLDRPDCRDKVGIHCCSLYGWGMWWGEVDERETYMEEEIILWERFSYTAWKI